MTGASTDSVPFRDDGPSEDGVEAASLLSTLELAAPSLEPLEFVGIHSVAVAAGDIEEARSGLFRIGAERFRLDPPIDWWEEPYRSPSSRGFLQNSFVFADYLLLAAERDEMIDPLARIFADWIQANPREGSAHPHPYAWHDHAAAGRLVYISFVLREGIRLGRVAPEVRLALTSSLLEHVQYIIEEDYVATHNHGLFSDAALALTARHIAPVDPSARWSELAEQRFKQVLEHTVDIGDGVHLEHSPYYHWIIRAAIERFASAGLFGTLRLPELAARMQESEAWLVAPDGTLPPFGDTPLDRAAAKASVELSRSREGLRAFAKAGYAAVRMGDSLLVVTAANHGTAHKHADDGSFCLYERGRALITDSGDPGYDYGGVDRRFGVSPAAHSTVSIDGFDWTRVEGTAYGSGLVAAADSGYGEYAILTRNPHAGPGGDTAARLFVYSPGRWLVVVDSVVTGTESPVVRHIQLAPDLAATAAPGGHRVVVRDELDPFARIDFGVRDGSPEELRIVRGLESPGLAGFAYENIGERIPRTAIVARSRGPGIRCFAIAIGQGSPAPRVEADGSQDSIEARIDVGGRRLVVSASPAGIDLRADAASPGVVSETESDPHGCNVCGAAAAEISQYNGRPLARCPTCGSLERHRILHMLWREQLSRELEVERPRVLLCSPSNSERFYTFADGETYVSDIGVQQDADIFVDVCDAVTLSESSFDLVVANHLFAHVYDLDAALSELRRVLRPGGMLIATTPVTEGATQEYTDRETITRLWGEEFYDRFKIGTFRLLGIADFLERLGDRFEVETIEAEDPVSRSHDSVYVMRRPVEARPTSAQPERARPVVGYPFHLSRRAGASFVFCLDHPADSAELPVADVTGSEVGRGTVGPFDGRFGPRVDYERPWEQGYGLPVRARFATPPGMRSGVYLLGGSIPFIVRHSGHARVAVLVPTNTAAAFNEAGGRSVYPTDDAPRADVVSFHRPVGITTFLQECSGFVRWMWQADLFPGDTTYLADLDLEDPAALDGVELLVIPGRSEYWTRAMRERFDEHVARGGRALLLCSEIMHWQVRIEPWRQQLIRYYVEDPEPDPRLQTRMWHDRVLEYPIFQRTGGEYWYGGRRAVAEGIGFGGMRVVDDGSPIVRACGLESGDVVTLDSSVWDGAPIAAFGAGGPQVDWQGLEPYRHEVIGFNRVDAAVPADTGGAPATSLWIALKRTATAGTVVHGGTFGWTQTTDQSGAGAEVVRRVCAQMMHSLLEDEPTFAEPSMRDE